MTARAVVAALTLAAVLVIGAVTDASARRAAPLFVDAREWSVTLSRASVPAGRVAIQLHNAGEDDHDLRLRKLNRRGRPAGRAKQIALTHPGAMTEAIVHLPQGRWRVWCTLDGHAAAGMRATLRAR